MRATADNGREAPAQIVGRLFDTEFFARLEKQFQFPADNPELVIAINRMGISYLISRRIEDWPTLADQRKPLKTLGSEIRRFISALKGSEALDIPQLMYFSALKLGEACPRTNFADLTEHEKTQSGEPYVRELLRLLTILEAGVADAAEVAAPKRGPKAILGLEALTLQAAAFFASKNRPFTIDAHKPFQATEAFDFVKMIVSRLDDISDENIVTAIRRAKTKIKNMGPNKNATNSSDTHKNM